MLVLDDLNGGAGDASVVDVTLGRSRLTVKCHRDYSGWRHRYHRNMQFASATTCGPPFDEGFRDRFG